MRGTRWLLLLAIVAVLAGVGITYRIQKRNLQARAPAKPAMLPTSVSGLRNQVRFAHSDGDRTTWEITAHKITQEQGTNQVHLDQVELKIYNKTGDEYNLVKCANAEFDQAGSRMYSEGEVEITLRVPVKGQPARPLTNIKSSGVRFDVKTGKAETDRPATFTFENGAGKAVGASYDPTTRELHLNHDAEINHQAPGSRALPMKIEAG